jgi:hypothetical protein
LALASRLPVALSQMPGTVWYSIVPGIWLPFPSVFPLGLITAPIATLPVALPSWRDHELSPVASSAIDGSVVASVKSAAGRAQLNQDQPCAVIRRPGGPLVC